jgi:outer membrane lipoprotein SlyB
VIKKLVLTALSLLIGTSSVFAQSNSQEGAVLGGVAGAIVGGIAGHQNGETPEGIAIGGVVGAITGGLLGKARDNQELRSYQYQQYMQQQRSLELQRAVSLSDAITMSRSGLSPNLIVSQIRSNGVQQRIGVQEIIALHENGVPEVVIQEMQKAPIAGASRVITAPQPTIVVERRPQVIVETYPAVRHYPHPPRYGIHYHYRRHW